MLPIFSCLRGAVERRADRGDDFQARDWFSRQASGRRRTFEVKIAPTIASRQFCRFRYLVAFLSCAGRASSAIGTLLLVQVFVSFCRRRRWRVAGGHAADNHELESAVDETIGDSLLGCLFWWAICLVLAAAADCRLDDCSRNDRHSLRGTAPNFVAVLFSQSQRLIINARKRLATRRRLIYKSKDESQQLESPLICLRREEGA